MDFVLEKHSALPSHAQIKEQVKIALLSGRIRPGDTLPSIRDVEKQTEISRNIVRKAYLELQESGILDLHHGKGVQVHKSINYQQLARAQKESAKLSGEVIGKLRRLGISPTAFARYLYQQARESEASSPYMIYVDATHELAAERALQVSSLWQMDIPGLAMDELAAMDRSKLKETRKVLTNYLRLEQVQKILKNTDIDVLPLGLIFKKTMIAEFSRYPEHANLVFVVDDRDFPSLTMILKLYRSMLMGPTMKIESIPLRQAGDLHKFVRSPKYHKVIFSNRIWNELPKEIQKYSKVLHPGMEIDLVSLENARISAGAIV